MNSHTNSLVIARRAQMEMLGLVFIVVIIVIGIVLYTIKIGASDSGKRDITALEAQQSPTFVRALADTSVPTCNNIPVSDVVGKCVAGDRSFCSGRYSCDVLQEFFEEMANGTLLAHGERYNLSLVGYPVTTSFECESANKRVATKIGKPQQIPTADGNFVNIQLVLC